jgi:hypothetical protein
VLEKSAYSQAFWDKGVNRVREIRKCSKYCPRRNLRGRKYPTADHVSIKL